MKNIILILFSITSLFAQYEIEGRWHLVGYEDNVTYQFEDDYRYSIYSIDGSFGGLDEAGGTPNPYTVVDSIITINLFFGTIVSYQMNYLCDGQVVEFVDNGNIHSTLFREGYNYIDNSCQECIDGEVDNSNPCNPMECWDGVWFEIIIDCAEWFGVPCEGGVYIPPPEDECCSECIAYGDTNYDSSLNVQDIVLMVDMALTGEYDVIADLNFDDSINVVDIVQLVNIILSN